MFVLALVYKPGSAQGAGETVLLPLPPRNGLGMRAAPEEPVLSADGRTLTYTCTIPETVIVNPGHPEEAVLSEAGLYPVHRRPLHRRIHSGDRCFGMINPLFLVSIATPVIARTYPASPCILSGTAAFH